VGVASTVNEGMATPEGPSRDHPDQSRPRTHRPVVAKTPAAARSFGDPSSSHTRLDRRTVANPLCSEPVTDETRVLRASTRPPDTYDHLEGAAYNAREARSATSVDD